MTCELVTRQAVGDVEALYRLLAPRLERIVRLDVRAPDTVIEDACQVAWTRLVDHFWRVRRETALPWLVRTAVREAVRQVKRDRRDLSLELVLEARDYASRAPTVPGPDERVEQREQLATIAALPVRQQRLLWLQGFGLSYAEMAVREGCTVRTVERQLLRAKGTMRRTSEARTE
jgi:RNA polymerase sigma factor (sigma-70 family)